MPGVSQIVFCASRLERSHVKGKRVLDVGACDYNGSIRPLLEAWNPFEYLGVDIQPGPRVDRVCSAEHLVSEFGEQSFDIVICLEMLEHARAWQTCISNMKKVLRPGGQILLTTRSQGYPCHGFPYDFWRFAVQDMKIIFADFEKLEVCQDPNDPGVFVNAVKPLNWTEQNLDSLEVYSIPTNKRETFIPNSLYKSSYYCRLALKQKVRAIANALFFGSGRLLTRFLKLK